MLLEDMLFLPFEVLGSIVVAQANGIDAYVRRKIGSDWLNGLSAAIVREFLLVKRASVDPLTGLLISLHLEEYLDNNDGGLFGAMVLLTVYPKSSSSFQAKKYQHRTVSLLKTFVDNRFPLYYLGQSCFGIVCEKCNSAFIAEFAPSLVNYLKRGGCYRVHVASAPFDEKGAVQLEVAQEPPSEILMKKVWAALHIATRRGPFSFCNYDSLERAAGHPLAPPPEVLIRWLRRETRLVQQFALLQFDQINELLLQAVRSLAVEGWEMFSGESELYLLLPEKEKAAAADIGRQILSFIKKRNPAAERINCGIGVFPAGDFRKSEMLLNCRKALSHAAFFEPGSVVVCDEVSCNIAGDMFYGDGDIVLAVKEYKRGLLLQPEDGNLLNSLGVCYAQMNRHKLAMECFDKACESKKDRFMALYNLGLEQQILNDKKVPLKLLLRLLLFLKEMVSRRPERIWDSS